MTATNLETLDRAEAELQRDALERRRDALKIEYRDLQLRLASYVRKNEHTEADERRWNQVAQEISDIDAQLRPIYAVIRQQASNELAQPTADDVARRNAVRELLSIREEAIEAVRDVISRLSAARHRVRATGGEVPARRPDLGGDFAAALIDCLLEPPSARRTSAAHAVVQRIP